MLVLSRKLGESIVIDGSIRVTILEVRGDNIKLGVQAPRHISVHREEIFQDILRSNQQAQQAVSPSLNLGSLGLAGKLSSLKPAGKQQLSLPKLPPQTDAPNGGDAPDSPASSH